MYHDTPTIIISAKFHKISCLRLRSRYITKYLNLTNEYPYVLGHHGDHNNTVIVLIHFLQGKNATFCFDQYLTVDIGLLFRVTIKPVKFKHLVITLKCQLLHNASDCGLISSSKQHLCRCKADM